MKVCKTCKKEKSLNLFPKDSCQTSGYSLYCKVCNRITQKAYRDKNKRLLVEKRKIWGIENGEALKKKERVRSFSITPGIYMVKNLITGAFYIGQSTRPYIRKANHFSTSEKKIAPLHLAMSEYGKKAFVFGIIEHCTEEELLERESYYIQKLKPQYNTRLCNNNH